jgi:hypothetical protein
MRRTPTGRNVNGSPPHGPTSSRSSRRPATAAGSHAQCAGGRREGTSDAEPDRARLVEGDHVALSVGVVDAAVAFHGDLFAVDLRVRTGSAAFLDMGDRLLALAEADGAGDPDEHRPGVRTRR